MINLRHTGVYVKNLKRMAAFYREVFHMRTICENFRQADALIADLLRTPEACVKITKLITEQGEANGTGDMIELIEIVTPEEKAEKIPQPIAAGMHVAFGVRDMETTRTAMPSLASSSCASMTSDTSEPVAMRMPCGAPFASEMM